MRKKQKRLSKKELAQPDKFISTTDKIIEKIYQFRVLVLVGFTLTASIGLSMVITNLMTQRQEKSASEAIFSIHHQIGKVEKELTDEKKKAKELAQKEEKEAEKNSGKNKKDKSKSKAATSDKKEKESIKWPRSEFDEKFSSLAQEYETHILAHLGTTNAVNGALFLSRLYARYNMWEEAQNILVKITTELSDSHLFYGLVHSSIGNYLVEIGKFEEALTSYEKVLASKNHQYLHENIYLKKGLILEQINQVEEAQATYKKVVDFQREDNGDNKNKPETQAKKSAAAYLKYLNFQKVYKDL